MSALALQLPDVVDPYDEALAYEYLYSIPHSSLKTISEQTVNRGVLPTEALDEIIVLQDEYSKVKTFLMTGLDPSMLRSTTRLRIPQGSQSRTSECL